MPFIGHHHFQWGHLNGNFIMLLRNASFGFAACAPRSSITFANHKRLVAECVILFAVSSTRLVRSVLFGVPHERIIGYPFHPGNLVSSSAHLWHCCKEGGQTFISHRHSTLAVDFFVYTAACPSISSPFISHSALHDQSQTHVRNDYSFIRDGRNTAH